MKSITLEEFKKFRPCWLEDNKLAAKLEEIGKRKERWTALDILNLPAEEVSAEDKLWAVLREELIEARILHEFACRCAEEALKLVENPDPRSVAAIEAKRKWLRGEITDEELTAACVAACVAARTAAWDAADAAWDAACAAAWKAAHAAWSAACAASWTNVRAAAWKAAHAAWYAADAAANGQPNLQREFSGAFAQQKTALSEPRETPQLAPTGAMLAAAWDAARETQVEMLRGMLLEDRDCDFG